MLIVLIRHRVESSEPLKEIYTFIFIRVIRNYLVSCTDLPYGKRSNHK